MKMFLFCMLTGMLAAAGGVDSGITPAALLAHIRVLASDELAGRGPGTPGEEKTVAYLLSECRKMGLQPGNPDGSFVQNVQLWGIRSQGTLTITMGDKEPPLVARQDYTATSTQPREEIKVENSPVVFVGYGVVAPEYHWNDYKHLDVRGKTVVLLSGDPGFLGEQLSYFGRAGTKSDIAYAKGAAAVISIFTPRNGNTSLRTFAQNAPRETMILRDGNAMKRVAAQASLTVKKAKELFPDFDALRQRALRPDFQPAPLQAAASFHVNNTLRQVDSANVIASVAGSDAKLKNEYVIYSGHWDHLGQEGDRIYHGASDNAAGTAGVLELAQAFTKLHPRRTVLFLLTTAEEKGLLGAKYYVEHPLYPLTQTVANINLDYFSNWGWGRTHDISIVGLGNSTVDDLVVAAAKRQGRVVTGDTAPEEGFYFRSDHFEFAKAGVPSLETSPGIEYIGKPAGYGVQKRTEYIRNDYHKVTDEPKADWDLTGAVEDLQVLLDVGYRLAKQDRRPTWKPNGPYRPRPIALPMAVN